MNAYAVSEFIGCDDSPYVAKVTIREELITKGSINVALAISIDVIHHQIHEWEVTSSKGTRLVLVRVRYSKGVVQSTVQEAAVKLGCDGREVLFLRIPRILEVQSLHTSTLCSRIRRVSKSGAGT